MAEFVKALKPDQQATHAAAHISAKSPAPAQLRDERPEMKAMQQLQTAIQRQAVAQRMKTGAPEEEELIQGKFKTIQRQTGVPEEEEMIQGKFEPIQKKPNRTGMPDNLKSGIENMSGISMDDVKVHYNSPKPATLQAHAYTQGTDIHVAPGQQKHLAHEAWHVVQQKQGRVQPTMRLNGQPVNDNAGLEKEADVMGAKAGSA